MAIFNANHCAQRGVGMNLLGVALHSLVLTIINIMSILISYALTLVIRLDNPIIVQVPVSLGLTIVGFLLWYLFVRQDFPQLLFLCKSAELVIVYVGTLVLGSILYLPIQLLTEITVFTNVLALWAFQIPVNLITLRFAGCTFKLKNGNAPSNS